MGITGEGLSRLGRSRDNSLFEPTFPSTTRRASEDLSATHENIWQRSGNAFPAGQ